MFLSIEESLGQVDSHSDEDDMRMPMAAEEWSGEGLVRVRWGPEIPSIGLQPFIHRYFRRSECWVEGLSHKTLFLGIIGTVLDSHNDEDDMRMPMAAEKLIWWGSVYSQCRVRGALICLNPFIHRCFRRLEWGWRVVCKKYTQKEPSLLCMFVVHSRAPLCSQWILNVLNEVIYRLL